MTNLLATLRVAVLTLCACALQPVWAQSAPPTLTAADAEVWLDGLMPAALHLARVPGAVVVIVKDGQPLVQKGYGFADWDKHIPVDPQRTLFRPGSVSKLFTWTAVMQLVEQGKLDLDADLNQYLDFQIPPRNGKALTLRHVMTHTTGLEETARDLLTFEPVTPDLGAVLKSYVPPYLYDPGSTPGYSNYATALAGYIVQRVSGKSFDEYLEQHVLGPLGMKQSTFRQPLPAGLAPQMSRGYDSWEQPAKGFEIISMPPAGSLSSTGADMGRFMLAFLQQGQLDGARILAPATVKQMFDQLKRPLPALSGIGLGFYEQNINGHRVMAHGGDTMFFHSDLMLFVDDGIGVYVSFNASGGFELGKWLRDRVFEGFADRYLPDTRVAAKPAVDVDTAKAHAHQMAGAYRSTRREDSTFLSLLQLLSPLQVQALEDGRVSIEIAGSTSVFREIKPYYWEEEHGKRRLQAVVENGRVKHWGLEPYVFAFVFEPVPFKASRTVLIVLCAALLVTLLNVLLWPVAAFLRRRHGVLLAPPRSFTAVRLACVLTALGIGLWAWVMVRLEALGDTSLLLPLAQAVIGVALLGGLGAAAWHARATFTAGGKAAKAGAVLWLLVFAVLVLVGFWHHLLGFNQGY
jgi:CubicO group peptidase (beta-lactamase class C family)